MLSIFRTNQILASLLLLPYAALLHVSVFRSSDWAPPAQGILAQGVYSLTGTTGWLPEILAILLLSIQGIWINGLMANHKIAREINQFPGLFYVLMASFLPELLHFSPLLMANFFLIAAFSQVIQTFQKAYCADRIFNTGFWIGIAGLFYGSYLIFILWGFMAINIMRAFRFKERLMLLGGAVTPYILTGVYFFWNDSLPEFFQKQFVENAGWLDFSSTPNPAMTFIHLGLYGFLLLIVLFSYNQYVQKTIIQVTKKISILFGLLLVSGITALFQAGLTPEHLLILAFPLGTLLSFNFTDLPKNWAELLHFILFATSLALQFNPFTP